MSTIRRLWLHLADGAYQFLLSIDASGGVTSAKDGGSAARTSRIRGGTVTVICPIIFNLGD